MNPVQICSSFLLSFITLNAQPKGFLYDGSRVSNYELPDPLICLDRTKVVNSKLWINKRRPEITNLFEQKVYGQSPLYTEPIRFELVEDVKGALGGKAIRKQVITHLGKGEKALTVNLPIYSPQVAKKPANQPVDGRICYHVRKSKHDVTAYDWEQYLDSADNYLK